MVSRSPSFGRLLTLGLTLVALVTLSGCAAVGGGPQSVNEPAGDDMRKIWDLFVPIFWMSVVVFVVVQGILIYAVIRFRRKPDQPMPYALHGNTKLEIAWTIAPALVLAVIAVPTMTTMFAIDADPGPEEAINVRVVGHKWWWEFEYLTPEGEVEFVTAGDLFVPVGQPVRLQIESADIIHSFWPPRLAGKIDAVPGWTNILTFTAEEPGDFRGQCAEFCGIQHANMAFFVVARPPEEFEAWRERWRQRQEPEIVGELALRGREVFMTTGACLACHAIDGTEAQGEVGPNLTNFGERRLIAGGVLTNTTENLRLWLSDPQAVKPGNFMAIPRLSDEDIEALVAYLESLQ